jgi:hypothetical protein
MFPFMSKKQRIMNFKKGETRETFSDIKKKRKTRNGACKQFR